MHLYTLKTTLKDERSMINHIMFKVQGSYRLQTTSPDAWDYG